MSIKAETVYIEVDAQTTKSLKGLKITDKQSNKLFSTFKKLAGPVAIGAMVAGAIKLGKEFSSLAANATEIENKFNVVFGNTAGDVKDWAQTYSDSVGRSVTDTESFLASMGDLLTPLGFNKIAVDDLSKKVVTLANDLGSFDNMPTADVMRDIQSAMVGNFEVTKKYGVVLNEAVIKQEAMNEGLFNGKGMLDAQTKAAVALKLIIKGNAAAQGDLLRTQNSAANTSRRLAAAEKDLGIEIGKTLNEGLTPFQSVMTDVVKSLTRFIKASNDLKAANKAVEGGTATLDQKILIHSQNIDNAKRSYDALTYAVNNNIKGAKERQAAIKDQIAAEAQAIASLQFEKKAQKEQNEINQKIAAEQTKAAEKLAARKKQIANEQAILDDAYNKTLQGQIDKQRELIKEWESYVPSDKRTAVLNDATAALDDLIKKQKEETSVSITSWKTQKEFAKEYYQSDEEWLADYYAKEKAAQDKSIADTKAAWNEKLAIASNFESGFESLFNQLSSNELTSITNTEDAKIKAITDSYDNQLALMDKDSQAYQDLQDQKTAAVKQAEDDKAAVIKTAKEKQWKIDKAFAVGKAIIDTISAVVEAAPNPWLMAAMGVLGAAQTAAIAAQPMPAFATGGTYTTNGPAIVGDNASGQERVTVEPLGGGSQGNGTMILNIDGQQFVGWLQNKIDNRGIRIPRGSLV